MEVSPFKTESTFFSSTENARLEVGCRCQAESLWNLSFYIRNCGQVLVYPKLILAPPALGETGLKWLMVLCRYSGEAHEAEDRGHLGVEEPEL